MNMEPGPAPEEVAAMRDLMDGPPLPHGLEDATVARVRSRGLLRDSPRRGLRLWSRKLLAIAAGLALFAAGLAAGRRSGPPGVGSTLPRYVLLLYDAPGEALTDSAMAARVSEFRTWAQNLRRQGNEIQGEKLEDTLQVLGPDDRAASGWKLGGYFVIAAKDDQAALSVARSCPHAKHGGRIEVRPIART